MTFEIHGLDELVSALASEGVQVEHRASEAVGRVAQKVKDTARSLAPLGPTGDLRDSISVSGRGTRREVGPTVRYGGFVEFGTYKDAPKPYMGPAADQHEGDLVDELTREVGNL